MTLKPGRYRIRYVPPGITPPFMGGLYVVATDFGEPILAEPLSPQHPAQIWEVRSSENRYTITQPGFKSKLPGIGPVLMGWSLSSPVPAFPGGKILFGVDHVELNIEPVKSGDNLTYSIEIPDPGFPHTVSMQFFVAESNQNLVSQPYWFTIPKRPHPTWEFIPEKSH